MRLWLRLRLAAGVFWAFNSVQRVTSVGSRMFVCEAVQWEEFGAPYLPWGPTFVGPEGIKGMVMFVTLGRVHSL